MTTLPRASSFPPRPHTNNASPRATHTHANYRHSDASAIPTTPFPSPLSAHRRLLPRTHCTPLPLHTQTSLNTVDNVETFTADIMHGRWDSILPQVAQLTLPKRKLEDLYEQVVLEMIVGG